MLYHLMVAMGGVTVLLLVWVGLQHLNRATGGGAYTNANDPDNCRESSVACRQCKSAEICHLPAD